MTKPNPQLQARAGKNRPSEEGVELANQLLGLKLTQNVLLVFEGGPANSPSVPTRLPSSVTLYNQSGADIDAQLVFVDEFGGEFVYGGTSTISNLNNNTFGPGWAPLEGQRWELRIVAGNVNAGSGVFVEVFNGALVPLLVELKSTKLTSPTYEATRYPGGVGENNLAVLNLSPNPVNYDVYTIFDGNPVFQYGGTLNANDVAFFGDRTSSTRGWKVVFAGLPAGGYLLAQEFTSVANEADLITP